MRLAFRSLYRTLWALALLVLVLLALYASLGRQYIGLVGEYRGRILEEIQTRTGAEVALESLAARWSGLAPIIEVGGLSIGSQDAIHIDSASIEVNVLSSLLLGRPQFNKIRLRQLRLDLVQSADGGWTVPGLSSGGDAAPPDWLIDTALGIQTARFDQFSLNLQYASGAKKSLALEDFALEGDGEFRRLYASLNTQSKGAIYLLAETYGDPRDPRSFNGNGYIKIDRSRFSALTPLFQEEALLVDSEVSGQLWLSWRRDQRLTLQGELNSPALPVGALWNAPDYLLEQVNMRFVGSHADNSWQISFADFDALWRGHTLDLAGLTMYHPEVDRWGLSLPNFSVGAWVALLSEAEAFPGQDTLVALAPKGTLKRIRLDWQRPEAPEQPVAFRLRAELDEVSVQPWQGAPGAEGVNGYVDVGADSGMVAVLSERATLSFPGLYDKPFELADVSAELRWQIADKRLGLESGAIYAKHLGQPMTASLALDIPLEHDAEDGPAMTLAIGASDADVRRHAWYTPKILNPSLLEWLDRGLQSGRVSEAAFLYHGSLRKAEEDRRSIQLALNVAAGQLQFLSDWPELVVGKAQLVLDNHHFSATTTDASFLDAKIDSAQVEIDEDTRGRPRLKVVAAADLDFAEGKRLLLETPIQGYIGSFLDDWTGQGQAAVDVNLQQILTAGQSPTFDVGVQLRLPALNLTEQRLSVSGVLGRLHYSSEHGLASESLQASVFGKPVNLLVSQRGGEVLVDGRTRLSAADLQHWQPVQILNILDGETDLQMRITAGGERPQVVFTSELQGLALLLPQPLFKDADEKRRTRVTVPLDSPPGESALYVAVDGTGQVGLRLRDGQLLGGHVRLGENTDVAPGVAGLVIDGKLPFAALSQWQMAMERYLSGDSLAGDAADQQPSRSAPPVQVRGLKVGSLEAMGQVFHEVSINADIGPEGKDIRLAGPELAGQIRLSAVSGSPIVLDLERLALASLSDDQPGDSESGLAELDPRTFPAIDLDIADLSVAGKSWGSIGFDLRSDGRGAHFDKLRGKVRGVDLNAGDEPSRLDWLREASGDRSYLNGQFDLGDLGDVLEQWGFTRAMESERGAINARLSWPGAPDQWQLLQSEGELNFDIEDGRFFRASDSASGALRLLSIFNMANIVRRLKFDFRDVFSSGIAFDSMRGALVLDDRQLIFNKPMEVKGPSSAFQMSGTIDLQREVPDLRLVATLPIGSNLPWLAALVGGLPAAAGAYVVSKVFEEQVDSFSSAVYDIGGTLSNPELTFQQIFDVDSASGGNESGPRHKQGATR